MSFMDKTIDVDRNAGIFVTLNPAGKGYGGRSKLPDNLKQLFRCARGAGQRMCKGCWPEDVWFRALLASLLLFSLCALTCADHPTPLTCACCHCCFRSIAMSVPDNELIAEVLLLSEGFITAKVSGWRRFRWGSAACLYVC